jgi:hypothetical protein
LTHTLTVLAMLALIVPPPEAPGTHRLFSMLEVLREILRDLLDGLQEVLLVMDLDFQFGDFLGIRLLGSPHHQSIPPGNVPSKRSCRSTICAPSAREELATLRILFLLAARGEYSSSFLRKGFLSLDLDKRNW